MMKRKHLKSIEKMVTLNAQDSALRLKAAIEWWLHTLGDAGLASEVAEDLPRRLAPHERLAYCRRLYRCESGPPFCEVDLALVGEVGAPEKAAADQLRAWRDHEGAAGAHAPVRALDVLDSVAGNSARPTMKTRPREEDRHGAFREWVAARTFTFGTQKKPDRRAISTLIAAEVRAMMPSTLVALPATPIERLIPTNKASVNYTGRSGKWQVGISWL